MRYGLRLMEQADHLGSMSQSPDGLTRVSLSPEHRRAGDYIMELMREAGMEAGYDALGNVVGRYAGADPDAPVIMTGSHLDSVVNAGKYDGLYGILSPIACVRELHQRGQRLAYGIEVVAFGDEEGVRFGITMMGSAAMNGRFDAAWKDRADANGITLAEALRAFGGDVQAAATLRRDFGRVACFIESHIEQGPVLLEAGLPVGVVTAIAGCTRFNVNVKGVAGHAGTVPMPGRHDALTAAAEMALAVERIAGERADRIVATVGKFSVAGGGAINVIPGDVHFTIDLRSGVDAERHKAMDVLRDTLSGIAEQRGVGLTLDPFFELPAAPCSPALQDQIAAAIVAHGLPAHRLASGAGHDAMQFAHQVPTAMLFVRCGNGGISHNPLETMTAEDAELSTSVLLHFMEHFHSH